jgi:hypothetical protein
MSSTPRDTGVKHTHKTKQKSKKGSRAPQNKTKTIKKTKTQKKKQPFKKGCKNSSVEVDSKVVALARGDEENLLDCALLLVRVYKLFGVTATPQQTQRAVKTAAALWTVRAKEIGWIKFMKYKLAAFFSAHTEQELPEAPTDELAEAGMKDAKMLLGGVFGRGARALLLRHPMVPEGTEKSIPLSAFTQMARRMEFLSTVLNAKKGMPLASLEEKDKKVLKTVTHLTTPETPPKVKVSLAKGSEWGANPDVRVELTVSDVTLIEQCRRTVQEAFKGESYTFADRVRMCFPSSSSNVDRSRAQAGGVGSIHDDPVMEKYRVPGGPLKVTPEEPILRKVDPKERFEEDVVDSATGMVDDDQTYYEYNKEALTRTYAEFWQDLLLEAEKEEPLVEGVGLLEALKIRVISKGPPKTYYALNSLQKKMHSVLRKKRCFQLIGKPDDAWVVQDLMGTTLEGPEAYLSGDYSAATDNFRVVMSNAISDELAVVLELSPLEAGLLRKALTEHIFKVNDEELDQKSGQLMGSIVSFPVLCLGNFAVSRWALEVATGKRVTMNDAPIGVNGDDLIMRGPKDTMRKAWAHIAGFAGLEESIGKTFLSRKFLNINSRTYIRTPPTPTEFVSSTKGTIIRDSVFQKTGFANFGILMGKKRSMDTEKAQMLDQTSKQWNASAISHALVNDAPEFLRKKLFGMWITMNKEELKATLLPWFIPEWLGGLGLPEEYGENSESDLKVAKKIVMNYSSCRPQALSRGNSPWFVREQAEKALPKCNLYLDRESEPVKALERLNADLAMNLLFDSDVRLTDIYRDVAKNPFNRALRHNRKLWKIKPTGGKVVKLPTKGLDARLLKGSRRYAGLLVKPVRGQKWPLDAERAKSIKEISTELHTVDALTRLWLAPPLAQAWEVVTEGDFSSL